MSMLMLRTAAKRTHALRGGRKACHCCADYGSTKNGARNRQVARQQQRRVEARNWRREISS